MIKFNKCIFGYNITEVNSFFDNVIKKSDCILNDNNNLRKELDAKNNRIKELETTLCMFLNNNCVNFDVNTKNDMILLAKKESNAIIIEAKENANRIINDALDRANKIEIERSNLNSSLIVYKSKVRDILNEGLDLIDKLNDN